MGYLQDKNHFIALTAEALLAPPVVNKVYVRLVSTAFSPPHPPARPGGPHLHAGSFPHGALKPKKRGKQNLIFMVN